jgi:hypothetical protein
MATKSGQRHGYAQRELICAGRSPEDLADCVVLLEREFTETTTVDGQDAEVWVKVRGKARANPKRARHVGTGFLVATRSAAFLVTAGHVAREMDGAARLSFATPSGRRATLALSQVVSSPAGPLPWTYQRYSDVAAIRIRKPPQTLRGHFLAAELLDKEAAAPPGSLRLTVVGFALGLVSEEHFTPLAKRSHAASPVLRFCGDERGDPPIDLFLLDQPSMGGYSGAPVFAEAQVQLAEGGQVTVVAPRCVGLISRTIGDDSGGQFAAVVPGVAVHRAMAKARRRERGGRGGARR